MEEIAQAIISHPNLEIMELVRSHTPSTANYEISHLQTFLTEACRGDWGDDGSHARNIDETLPLIHCLLDNGAEPREGSWRGCGALYAALEFSWPLEIIDKMVQKGGEVNLLIFLEAVIMRWVDALLLFFDKAMFDISIEKMLDIAQESEDKEIMSVVNAGVAKLKQQQPKWWQFWR